MRTSQKGVDLIKSFEGFSPSAVRLEGEQYYTIGYGHYGVDVRPNQTMTRDEAEALLRKDLIQFEGWVTSYCEKYAKFTPNQNQFDALVSFCYNLGPANLKQLVYGRGEVEVAAHIPAYTNSGSEKYRQGLIRRRAIERNLFLQPITEVDEMERWHSLDDIQSDYYKKQVKRLMAAGIIAGKKDGDLDLTEDMLRVILICERMKK